MRKVRVGQTFTFQPVLMDVVWSQHHSATPGQKVKVVKLPGAPPPGTMGQAHVADAATGDFLGMVNVNSLVKS